MIEPMKEAKSGARRPRLLYLMTEYPHLSHTFIRREIRGRIARLAD